MLPLKFRKDESEPLHLLCLGAHADDIEIGCGATVLELIDAFPDISVTWVVFSGNEKRKAEAHAAAERFLAGVKKKEVVLQEFRDGFFPWFGDAIKDFFESLKRRLSPDIILTHAAHDAHQDHRQIQQLTWNTWRDHLILEYEVPKWDGDLGRPNYYVPVTRANAEKKIEILNECFVSQQGRDWFDRELFLGLMRVRGMEARAAENLAEAFYARKLVIG